MTVIIDDRALRRAATRMVRDIEKNTDLYRRAAQAMAKYMRETITLQGRRQKFAPLSKWTVAATGRRKALLPVRDTIKAEWDRSSARVISGKHGQKHNFGINVSATRKTMAWLNRDGSKIVLRSRKAYKVPARKYIPTGREAESVVKKSADGWIRAIVKRNWHD